MPAAPECGGSGLLFSELAKRLEWTQAEVSKCETGVRRLDVIELKLWVEALDGDLSAFVQDLQG